MLQLIYKLNKKEETSMFTLIGLSAFGLQTVNQPVFQMKEVNKGTVIVSNTSNSTDLVSVTGKRSEIYINGQTVDLPVHNYFVAPHRTIQIFSQSGYKNQKFTVKINNSFSKQFKSAY